MEAKYTISPYCICCLKADSLLRKHNIQNEPLKKILQGEINLCCICFKIAQYTDTFVGNIQKNQELLLDNTTINPIIKLSIAKLEPLELKEHDTFEESKFIIYHSKENNIKTEVNEDIKLEDSFSDSSYNYQIKLEDEDEVPLLLFKKERNDFLESIAVDYEEVKLKRKCKNKVKTKIKTNLRQVIKSDVLVYNKIILTHNELLTERDDKLLDPTYQSCQFKCSDCILVFNNKMTYDAHMQLHDKGSGNYACEICKQYLRTYKSLTNHVQNHYIRYQCKMCDFRRNVTETLRNHYSLKHNREINQLYCPKLGCDKTFTLPSTLRKHIYRVHNNKTSKKCKYCNKYYKNIAVHLKNKHPTEISSAKIVYNHPCKQCERSFTSVSHLKAHMVKHLETRDFYCVECDKKFKSAQGLKAHLRTSVHVTSKDYTFACTHCDKRFLKNYSLERHIMRVMNIKKYKCDQCDKAFTVAAEMKNHKKLLHEGYELPRRYKCKYCDKGFKTATTLKHHILIHTGERPYQCNQCSASFNQSSILRTHTRLVHLRLGRQKKLKCNLVSENDDTISS